MITDRQANATAGASDDNAQTKIDPHHDHRERSYGTQMATAGSAVSGARSAQQSSGMNTSA